METSLKTGFAQISSCCPKNLSCPKFEGAAAPLAPPARTPMTRVPFAKNAKYFRCHYLVVHICLHCNKEQGGRGGT